jgi:AcrR family transcriptional regulator
MVGSGTTGSSPARRQAYRSEQRQQQAELTRGAILTAAQELFGARGWAGVGMRDIAAQAGVAVETVYSSIGSKVEVLLAAMDTTMAVGHPEVPLTQRPEVAALAQGDFADRVAAAAKLTALGNKRTIGLHKALREGAASDPQLKQAFDSYVAGRRRDYRRVVALVAQRELTPAESDGLWAVLSRDVYELLVEHCGWSVRRYQSWVESMIGQALG